MMRLVTHVLRLHVETDAQAEPATDHIRDLLFTLARELLLNVVKHADATQTWLSLKRRSEAQIELEVRDNGVGFDATNWSPTRQGDASFGLGSIHERLQLLGGNLQVQSAPGQGCRVTLTAPASDGA